MDSCEDVMAALDGPFGSLFDMSKPFYQTFKGAKWVPSANSFPVGRRGDCFYHEARDKVYVYDGRGWFELKEPPARDET